MIATLGLALLAIPVYADNNGPWTPELSKTADRSPSEPRSPRGWYPPVDGSPDVPYDLNKDIDKAKGFINSIVTSPDVANPLVQGGRAIGRTYDAAERGDTTETVLEANDGIGRLLSIGLGAKEGMAAGTLVGGLPGAVIGGIIGGFLGNVAWNKTGGALNEESRQLLEQQRQQARMQALQNSRQGVQPTRSSSGRTCICP